jgi:hypothetical protein
LPDPGVQFGLQVPWKVEVDGDINKCKCKYIDDGKMGYEVKFGPPISQVMRSKPEPVPSEPREIPCRYSLDRPGPHLNTDPELPSTGFAEVTIDYALTMTLICEDEGGGGTKSASVKLEGRYYGRKVEWPTKK